MDLPSPDPEAYWDAISETYQSQTRISTDDFHYGPLLPGDRALQLLPSPLSGLRCLEIGCGAGQNSIYLAKQGARCSAWDISGEQLKRGKQLATADKVDVLFEQKDMESLNDSAAFDLIHSAYALPFSKNPAELVKAMLKALRPGGTLLLSTGHPLYGNEWMSFDDGEEGLFVEDYFDPLEDLRMINDGDVHCRSRTWPVSEMCHWITDCGGMITALNEPKALPDDELATKAPYFSEDWAEQANNLRKVPIVLILRALRPKA